MGRAIRAETNSPTILEQIKRLGKHPGGPMSHQPEFLWRLVSDPDAVSPPPWPPAAGLIDGALRLVTFGQCNFIAVDFDNQEAVAFLAEELARDDAAFRDPFLAVLCCLTAEGLGLVPAAALSDLLGVQSEGLR